MSQDVQIPPEGQVKPVTTVQKFLLTQQAENTISGKLRTHYIDQVLIDDLSMSMKINRLVTLFVLACAFITAYSRELYADSRNIIAQSAKDTLSSIKSGTTLRVLHVYGQSKHKDIPEAQLAAFRKATQLLDSHAKVFEVDLSTEGGDTLAAELKLDRDSANAVYFVSSPNTAPTKYADDLTDGGVLAAKAFAYLVESEKAKKTSGSKPAAKSSSSSSSSSSPKPTASNGSDSTDDLSDLTFGEAPGRVVELTDSTFDKEVMKSAEGWFVSFTAPWCGHCKNLKPEYTEAAGKLRGKIWFGNVDCTSNQSLCQRFGVRGYPTIKFFRGGRKAPKSQGIDYNQARSAQALANFAEDEYKRYSPKPGVPQLKTQDHWKNCLDGRLCFVAILPKNQAASARKTYLETLKSTMTDLQRLPQKFKWLWTEAGQFPGLEDSLGLTPSSPVPNFAVVNPKRMGRVTLLAEEGASAPEFKQSTLRELVDQVLSASRSSKSMRVKPGEVKISLKTSRSEL